MSESKNSSSKNVRRPFRDKSLEQLGSLLAMSTFRHLAECELRYRGLI